jgi:hypothetical protein
VSDDDTAATVAGAINSHMAHLSQQTAASLEANASQINASLQQLATNNDQLYQQQQSLMQQKVMLTTNANVLRTRITTGGVRTNYLTTVARPPIQIYAPPPLQVFQQLQPYYPSHGGGQGGGRSCQSGCGQRGHEKCHLPKSNILPLVALVSSPTSLQDFSLLPINKSQLLDYCQGICQSKCMFLVRV